MARQCLSTLERTEEVVGRAEKKYKLLFVLSIRDRLQSLNIGLQWFDIVSGYNVADKIYLRYTDFAFFDFEENVSIERLKNLLQPNVMFS